MRKMKDSLFNKPKKSRKSIGFVFFSFWQNDPVGLKNHILSRKFLLIFVPLGRGVIV